MARLYQTRMEVIEVTHAFKKEEIEKAKAYMAKHPDYKVSDVQRVILKGYTYTAKLIDLISEKC